jgi:hexose oxidase
MPTSALSRRGFLAGVGLAGAVGLATPATRSPARAAEARERPVLPSDRQGFNRRWYAPALQAVYAPLTADEATACVQDALSTYGRDVKVASGRHCYEGFVYNDATRAIIDMSGVCGVGYDPERGAYFVDAGAENWTAYRSLLNGYGVTLPAGSCYSVGAGGHISGGGFGLLSRLHGLTIDHVTGIDVVTWDAATSTARLRHVSESSADADERDLFWALRGAGGGNYGVITRFWFANLPAAPAWASVWQASWDWQQMREPTFTRLVSRFATLAADLPHHQFVLFKLRHQAAGSISLTLQVASGPQTQLDGHLVRAQRAVRKVREALGLPPSQQAVRHYPYLEAVQTLNGSGPNQFGKYKSAYINAAFSDDQLAAMYDGLRSIPAGIDERGMAESLVQVDTYGGAINAVAPSATAVSHRSSIMSMQFQTYWDNRSAPGEASAGQAGEQQRAHVRWIRDIYEATFAASGGTPDPLRDPSGIVDGCYYNYPDTDLGTAADGRLERALRLYFGQNLRGPGRNLVAIKSRWDPQNFFHHAQSIPVE